MGDDRDVHLPTGESLATAAVVLHPHPGMGGDRHHPLVVELATRLSAAGVTALRLDLLDPSVPTAAAALEAEVDGLRTETAAERVLLVGYSWGAAVAAHAAPDGLAARVLVAPPVTMLDLPARPEPALVLVPAHDQYGPPGDVEAALGSWPDATVEVVPGCDNFLAGAVARISERAVSWLRPHA
jgi:alpha/beta superfamily hydrolase